MPISLAIDDDDVLTLIEAIAGTPHGQITRAALEAKKGKSGLKLLDACFLVPSTDDIVVTADDDFDDLPVTPVWDAEKQAYGYFSAQSGWVSLKPETFSVYALNIPVIVGKLLAHLLPQPRARIADLAAGCIWEVGDIRLPGRQQRVPVWLARRLSDPHIWTAFVALTKDRPASGLRLVLSLTPAARLPKQYIHGHEIVLVRTVLDLSESFAIDPDALASRLKHGAGDSGAPIRVDSEGGTVTVRGKALIFRGSKQRAIIRHLWEALLAGSGSCLTEQVLEAAGCGLTVRKLAEVFKGRTDWREFIHEQNGQCWIEI